MWTTFLRGLSGLYADIVKATNEIHSNVWAIVILCFGVIVHALGYADVGRDLIVGGFATLRATPTPPQVVSTTNGK